MRVQSTDFITTLGTLIERHLVEQEDSRDAVSLLASGAAFEAWLSFETRLLMERHRKVLDLDGTLDDDGEQVPRYWIANEYKKVDLAVLDVRDGGEAWEAAFEFKVVHSNKNYSGKCDEILADLCPRAGTKKDTTPVRGRFAIVAVVGKVYRDPGPYGWRSDLEEWEREELWPRLLAKANRMDRCWQSKRFLLNDPWLVKTAKSFCELHALRLRS